MGRRIENEGEHQSTGGSEGCVSDSLTEAELLAPGEHLDGPARRQWANDLARVDAPALRSPQSGRFVAGLIADWLGVTTQQLAEVVGVTQEALADNADMPEAAQAQRGLKNIARAIVAVEELIPPEHVPAWLMTPRPAFRGSSPLEIILRGDADHLARQLEAALNGVVD